MEIHYLRGGFTGLGSPPVGTTYQWSNGANGPVIPVLEAGVYKVTVTDATGCSYVPPAKTVEINPAPGGAVKAVLLDDNGQAVGIALFGLTTCAGEDVLLLADADGAYTYQWSVPGTGTTQYFTEDRKNLLSVGTHTFTVTLTNPATGCTATTRAVYGNRKSRAHRSVGYHRPAMRRHPGHRSVRRPPAARLPVFLEQRRNRTLVCHERTRALFRAGI